MIPIELEPHRRVATVLDHIRKPAFALATVSVSLAGLNVFKSDAAQVWLIYVAGSLTLVGLLTWPIAKWIRTRGDDKSVTQRIQSWEVPKGELKKVLVEIQRYAGGSMMSYQAVLKAFRKGSRGFHMLNTAMDVKEKAREQSLVIVWPLNQAGLDLMSKADTTGGDIRAEHVASPGEACVGAQIAFLFGKTHRLKGAAIQRCEELIGGWAEGKRLFTVFARPTNPTALRALKKRGFSPRTRGQEGLEEVYRKRIVGPRD